LTHTIDLYGSKAQKDDLLPKLRDLDLIGGWGLTEILKGSEANNLDTRAERQPDGSWVLNGNKRWIGNANKDLMVVFARDTSDRQIKAFIIFLD